MADVSSRPFELPRPGSSGDQLLDKMVAHLVADGDPRDSLRSLAEAIGTSHRMLQYHFLTKERMLGAVLLKIRQRSTGVPTQIPETRAEFMRMAWAMYRQPENFIMLELLLIITNPAAGAVTDESLMKQMSGGFADYLIGLGVKEGLTPERSKVESRLIIDAWRGLHEDLYGTLDSDAVDAALDVLIEWVQPRR
jgi:hypothetical protein